MNQAAFGDIIALAESLEPSNSKRGADFQPFSAFHKLPTLELAHHLADRTLKALQTKSALFEAFVGLTALYAHQQDLVSGKHFVGVAQALISTETQSGGPYLTAEYTERGVLTNAAIASFMQLLGAPLPNLTVYLQKAVTLHESGTLKLSAKARHYLAQATNTPDNAEDTTSLLPPGQLRLHTAILAACERHIAAAPSELRQPLSTALSSIQAIDTHQEISLMSLLFAESLTPGIASKSRRFDQHLHQLFGVANVFCWIAYTLYDNILDNESDATALLPTANIAHRIAYMSYRAASENTQAIRLIDTTFANMDAANSWELRTCRAPVNYTSLTIHALPRYGNRTVLAQRSFAHILGPLLLLLRLGHTSSSPAFLHIAQGLRHFLIARQLQDDLHDWVEDLQAGQLSFIVSDMLRQLRIQSSTYEIGPLAERMKRMFWERGLTHYNAIIIRHTRAANTAFARSGLITMQSPFISFIDNLEQTAIQAEQKYRQNQDFVQQYR